MLQAVLRRQSERLTVVASGHTVRLVHESPRESDERAIERKESDHFCLAQGRGVNDTCPDGVAQDEVEGTAISKITTNTDKKCGACMREVVRASVSFPNYMGRLRRCQVYSSATPIFTLMQDLRAAGLPPLFFRAQAHEQDGERGGK